MPVGRDVMAFPSSSNNSKLSSGSKMSAGRVESWLSLRESSQGSEAAENIRMDAGERIAFEVKHLEAGDLAEYVLGQRREVVET